MSPYSQWRAWASNLTYKASQLQWSGVIDLPLAKADSSRWGIRFWNITGGGVYIWSGAGTQATAAIFINPVQAGNASTAAFYLDRDGPMVSDIWTANANQAGSGFIGVLEIFYRPGATVLPEG